MSEKLNPEVRRTRRNENEKMGALNVVYVLLRFPYVTETFIAEEIQKVQDTGVKIRIYSLLPPRDELINPLSLQLIPKTQYAPGIHKPTLWWAQINYLQKSPDVYINLLRTLLMQPAPKLSFYLKRFVVFLKSIWLVKELEGSLPQLIHAHFAWLPAAAGLIASQLLDIPFTVTAHAYDIYSQNNDLLKLTTDKANRVVTISEHNKQKILEINNAITTEKIEIVHCGIDQNYFQATKKNNENNVLQITAVGSLVEKKGHEYLIQACGILKDKGICFQCDIVGGGKLEKELKNKIEHLRLNDFVTLAGPQTQTWIRDKLYTSDIFVLACVVTDDGDRDGIPVAMMEAMALGVPVISTPVSGIPELIRDEETGLLIPERNPTALALAIERLLQDKSLCQKLAKNGCALIERDYNVSKNAYQLRTIFQQVIEEKIGYPKSD